MKSDSSLTTQWITDTLMHSDTESELEFIIRLFRVADEYITIDKLDVIRSLVTDKRCAQTLSKVDADTLRFVVNQKVFSKLPDYDYKNLMYSIEDTGLNLPKINSHSSTRDILENLYADAVSKGLDAKLDNNFELFVTRAVNQLASFPEDVNESSFVYPHMIAIAYGQKTVTEVISALEKSGLNWRTCDLVEVVKNWDSLKSYTIDWVFNLYKH